MKKTILYILLGIVGIVLLFILYINFTWDKDFDVPYPEITASTDSAVIAHGSYLVYGAAHCAYCHVPVEKIPEVAKGEKVPLSGGGEFDIPPAIFRTPNLTPHDETGIGKLTDGELARALRYSVSHKNKFLAPFMAFQDISDDDLTAIISFLRDQEPVEYLVPPNEYRFLGKALLSLGMLKPAGPTRDIIKSIEKDTTIEYGSYLANSVANCVGCHTNRDMKTGEFIGEPFAGGFAMPAEPFAVKQKGYVYITPNLTPEQETGRITNWSEEVFIGRMRGGRVYDGSPMPWEAFATMDDTDLKALYGYLNSLEPVANKIDIIAIAPE